MILVRFTIDNRNRLIFYGNTVGYVKDDAAVVDEMFQTDELSRYLARLNLTPQWKEGVFDRLAAGEAPGEGYIDTAVKVLIAVVLGALVLAGLYAVLNDTVMPTVTERIQEMFDYAG